jgi:hypothetical protein
MTSPAFGIVSRIDSSLGNVASEFHLGLCERLVGVARAMHSFLSELTLPWKAGNAAFAAR